jgi:hypothetical protein
MATRETRTVERYFKNIAGDRGGIVEQARDPVVCCL